MFKLKKHLFEVNQLQSVRSVREKCETRCLFQGVVDSYREQARKVTTVRHVSLQEIL